MTSFDLDSKMPLPWAMSTLMESKDRQFHKEISVFEATSPTFNLSPQHRIPNPSLCVKKYRRSAAGGGVADTAAKHLIRKLENLDVTVKHVLFNIFSKQRSYGASIMKPRSLCKTASFVDDRLRAVQVDFVMYHQSSQPANNHSRTICNIQIQLVRYNILCGYLLSGVPSSKFEHKFNTQALRIGLNNFFDSCFNSFTSSFSNDEESVDQLDEIMCYSSLLHTCAVLLSREPGYLASTSAKSRSMLLSDSGGGFSALLTSDALRHTNSNKVNLPKWKWSLQIAAAADVGNYVRLLDLLLFSNSNADGITPMMDEKYRILCRCCISPALSVIRIGMLRQLNKSFAKAESVSGSDIARILHMNSSEHAISFCELVGLPVADSKKVLFKTGPISLDFIEKVGITFREDSFVFCTESCSIIDRVDEDGVGIPHCDFIRKLIGG